MRLRVEGGCLCGAVRYAASGEPSSRCLCHCRLCRRSSGAPVMAWASFPADGFAYTRGHPVRYASSEHGYREFCGRCGTQLAFRSSREPGLVDVNVCTTDDDQGLRPQMHIHCESELDWWRDAGGLPRYEGAAPA